MATPRQLRCARDAACGRQAGRAGPAARLHSRSTAITTPTSCAMAVARSAGCRGANMATASAFRGSSKLLKKSSIPATFFVPAVTRTALPGRTAARHRGRARDRAAWLDSRAQFRSAREGRTGASPALGGNADRDHGHSPRRHAHALLGFLPGHAHHSARDGSPLRLLADGRRRSLRTEPGWRTHRDRGAARRVDQGRRGLFQHEPVSGVAALHAATGRAGYFPARVRSGL